MNSSFLSGEDISFGVTSVNDELEENDSFLQYPKDSPQGILSESEFLSFPDFNSMKSDVALPLHSTPVKQTKRCKTQLKFSTVYSTQTETDSFRDETPEHSEDNLSFSVIPDDYSVTEVSPVTKKRKLELHLSSCHTDSDIKSDNDVDQTHLPHGLTKQDIYLTMKRELSQQGIMSTISLSHFYDIWNTSFKRVLIPKVYSVYSYVQSIVIIYYYICFSAICSVSATFAQCTIRNVSSCVKRDFRNLKIPTAFRKC